MVDTERKPLSKKIRFEVFKRDKFTCQYCGSKAPEVVLHVDHIKPVAGGGDNDILNLVAACSGCNGGKGARPLSNFDEVEKQHDQLAMLEERRQQIEMMMDWRDELRGLSENVVDMIVSRIEDRTDFSVNDAGRADITRWLKRYEPAELMRAVDESFDTYLQFESNKATSESWNKAFSKIPGTADILKQEEEKPYLRRLLYIQGIIRRRARIKHYKCVEYLEHVHLCGVTLDDLERRAKRMSDIEDFEAPLDAWLESIGRAY